jgi:DNA-directed RNA polymerase II subunit RPB2
VLASNIPFPDHNQSPRNTYQSAMGKQAIGVYASNYKYRFDTMSHVLNHPQRPTVSTRVASLLGADALPSGQNVVVAIATYTGFNQEDSVIFNRSAADRGLFNTTTFRTIKDQCHKNHSTGEEEFYCRPDRLNATNIKPYNFDLVNDGGYVTEGTYLSGDDVVLGKSMPVKKGHIICNNDNSVTLKHNEGGFVDISACNDRFFKNTNGDGYTFAKVKIRNTRVPTVGDKFSSRHGQKGTVGMVYEQCDMPFTADGITPDIIVNPHAIPSRMTIAQLFECVLGKACTLRGARGDGTPFQDGADLDAVGTVLQTHGFSAHGDEVMYNSRTGHRMNARVFIGPTYYQRLKHMVRDKIHSRANNGPVVMLTRQPAEGRARDGGLRLGEMECQCLESHGTLQFLKERIMECSDNYRVFTCRTCGMIANVNPDKGIAVCSRCENTHDFVQVRIPYATKLMLQELQCFGIGTRIR